METKSNFYNGQTKVIVAISDQDIFNHVSRELSHTSLYSDCFYFQEEGELLDHLKLVDLKKEVMLLVLDCNFSKGLSCFDFIKQILALVKSYKNGESDNFKIVLLIDSLDRSDLEDLYSLGIFEIVVKQFDHKKFRRVLGSESITTDKVEDEVDEKKIDEEVLKQKIVVRFKNELDSIVSQYFKNYVSTTLEDSCWDKIPQMAEKFLIKEIESIRDQITYQDKL